MKVLYDHQIFVEQKFGGINRYFVELMNDDSGSVEVDRIDPDLFRIEKEIIDNSLYGKGKRFVKRKFTNNFPEKKDLFSTEIKNLLENKSFDIFHPTYYNNYFIDIINKPFVLTVYDMIHEIYKEYFPLNEKTSANKRNLCKSANAIIAISHQTKNDLIDLFDIPEEKIYVTHLASDFNKYISEKPKFEFDLKNFMLFVGNRWTYKNFYFFITSIAEILKSDSTIQLLCTGHPFNDDEIEFFIELGIYDQIKHVYLNNDNELAWAYQNAKLFVFPSLYEGFGLPILEAFASSCPVVTSSGGSLPEVAGDAALYFDPKNAKQIREAVNTVLYNSVVRNELTAKGRQRYNEFSWDKCRAETQIVYKQLVK